MKPIARKSRDLLRLCVFLASVLNVAHYFFPVPALSYAANLAIIYIFVFSMTDLPKGNRFLILGLALFSTVLLLYAGADWRQWSEGMSKNGLLVALFTFGGLLHLPFQYEDYQSELKNLARRHMHTMIPFNLLISIVTHIFGALTGFAAFNIVYGLFWETSRYYNAEDIFLATLGRSYATSGFWGTSWASVVLIVAWFGVPWYRMILLGVVFTAVSFAINLAGIKLKTLRRPGRYPSLPKEDGVLVDWPRIRMMIYLAAGIVLVILAVNLATGWSLLAIVPIISVLFPLFIALPQRKWSSYQKGVRDFAQSSLYKSRLNACLFTAAGLLAYALDISGAGQKVTGLIPQALVGHPYPLVLALMLIMVLSGQLGLHPMAVGTTIITTIIPSTLGLSASQFAMAVVCGWLLSNMLSPVSALNITLSGLSGRNGYQTGLKLSWFYGLVCMLVYAAMLLPLSAFL